MRLCVKIPLAAIPWLQPRVIWERVLAPVAKREGRAPKKSQQQWLAEFQQPHPDLGQRDWELHITASTSPAEALTWLVITARKAGFPVLEDEERDAWRWIHRVMRAKLHHPQLVEDLIGQVYEGLVKRFDLPSVPWTLRAFIQVTTHGLATDALKEALREAWKQRGLMVDHEGEDDEDNAQLKAGRQGRRGLVEPELEGDLFSGERVYPPILAAQELGVSERTVYRKMKKQGLTKGLTGETLEALKQAQRQKQQQKALMTYLTERMGKTKLQAKEWIRYRQGKGLSLQDMVRTLDLPQQPQAEC